MAWLFGILFLLLLAGWWFMVRMPGRSYSGEAPTAEERLVDELRRDVQALCGEIGERNVYTPAALEQAAEWIETELRSFGYAHERQTFEVSGTDCANIIVERPGSDEIVVVGAHYDSVPGCPAANDNGSGVAATLALARRFAARPTQRTLRFVFFVNEEPPWFQTDDMGSLRYARLCKERGDKVVAMISVETIGYFTDEPDSQSYPLKPLALVYPGTGNFVALVGNVASRNLVHRALKTFREHATIPSEGVAMIGAVPGVGWSDHWSFWQVGYEAIMVTDTAPFRYPHYHEPTDTPDKLDYDGMARVVRGLEHVVTDLVDR
ncbi:MAG: M28 family peptidase [Planctomycetota bacterium]|jgi:hypothetical protein